MSEPRYYTRGYLPHFDVPEATQFLTWRLEDAIPPGAWAKILADTEALPEEERRRARMRSADLLLDAGHGSAALKSWPVARAVQDTLWFGHGKRYRLHAYVVMPNHVHAVLTLLPGQELSTVVRTVKSYSAREANRILKRSGRFWQIEVFDRLIRSPEHFERTVQYVEWNPVKAKLVEDPRHFCFSSAFPANAERLAREV
ncbi:MAG TPA: transposase [Fimbriimonadaceae bacterium]|nr:transposase [Fimbriimonadaceae bacterium]